MKESESALIEIPGWDDIDEESLTPLTTMELNALDAKARERGWKSVRYWCAQDDTAFDVYYGRAPGEMLWKIKQVKLITEEEWGGEVTEREDCEKVPFHEFDMSAWECPVCEAQSIVRCGCCSKLVCQGRSKHTDQGLLFVCRDSCGHQGIVMGQIDQVNASANGARSAMPGVSGGEEG